jgi:hypothetical protein
MWEPRRLINLWASTACYKDSLFFKFNYQLLDIVFAYELKTLRAKEITARSGIIA